MLALVASACGGGGDDDATAESNGGAVSSGASSGENAIDVDGERFVIDQLTCQVGGTEAGTTALLFGTGPGRDGLPTSVEIAGFLDLDGALVNQTVSFRLPPDRVLQRGIQLDDNGATVDMSTAEPAPLIFDVATVGDGFRYVGQLNEFLDDGSFRVVDVEVTMGC